MPVVDAAAAADLIERLTRERDALRDRVAELERVVKAQADRIFRQSELLSRRAEAAVTADADPDRLYRDLGGEG